MVSFKIVIVFAKASPAKVEMVEWPCLGCDAAGRGQKPFGAGSLLFYFTKLY